MVRVFIVGSEYQTLLLNAGFFSYMYFNAFYTVWLEIENRFEGFLEDKIESEWNSTKALFTVQKSHFFILAMVNIINYYMHTYSQATWRYTVEADKKKKDSSMGDKKVTESTTEPDSGIKDSNAAVEKASKSDSKQSSKGVKSSSKKR